MTHERDRPAERLKVIGTGLAGFGQVQLTPEMVAAGVAALRYAMSFDPDPDSDVVTDIYLAMREKAQGS